MFTDKQMNRMAAEPFECPYCTAKVNAWAWPAHAAGAHAEALRGKKAHKRAIAAKAERVERQEITMKITQEMVDAFRIDQAQGRSLQSSLYRAFAVGANVGAGLGPKEQWWLARLDRYGNPTLCDGAHSARDGVEHALYLIKGLGLDKGDRYAAVHLTISEVEPRARNTQAASAVGANVGACASDSPSN